MNFLVAKTKYEALTVARTQLLWKQIGPYKMLDLYRNEVLIIREASEMRGYTVERVYTLPSFDRLDYNQWESFQRAFHDRNITPTRLL